jgi:hypothetical protein
MTDFTKFAFAAFVICAFVSGFLVLASFINIAAELNRARRVWKLIGAFSFGHSQPLCRRWLQP